MVKIFVTGGWCVFDPVPDPDPDPSMPSILTLEIGVLLVIYFSKSEYSRTDGLLYDEDEE